MLSCSNAVVYTYDLSLHCFTKLADRWWAEGSEVWQRQQRSASTSGGNNNQGPVAYVEGYCIKSPAPDESTGHAGDDRATRPPWWSEALTLGHLETRIYAAKTFDSPAEYKQALVAYARKIAEEGFRWKAEELIRELFGPVYWWVI